MRRSILLAIMFCLALSGNTASADYYGQASYQLPIIPIKFSIDQSGHFSVSLSGSVNTPVGSFSLAGGYSSSSGGLASPAGKLIVRIEGREFRYDLQKAGKYDVRVEGGLVCQRITPSNGSVIVDLVRNQYQQEAKHLQSRLSSSERQNKELASALADAKRSEQLYHGQTVLFRDSASDYKQQATSRGERLDVALADNGRLINENTELRAENTTLYAENMTLKTEVAACNDGTHPYRYVRSGTGNQSSSSSYGGANYVSVADADRCQGENARYAPTYQDSRSSSGYQTDAVYYSYSSGSNPLQVSQVTVPTPSYNRPVSCSCPATYTYSGSCTSGGSANAVYRGSYGSGATSNYGYSQTSVYPNTGRRISTSTVLKTCAVVGVVAAILRHR